ncbi:T9SS type A sorting domain-containing protein [Hymenobacter glaciei]
MGNTSDIVAGVTVPAKHAFVLKSNGAGVVQWVQLVHADTGGTFNFLTLGAKPAGGCLLTGTFGNSPLYLGAGTGTPILTPNVAQTRFVIGFDVNGSLQWSQQLEPATVPAQSVSQIRINAFAADANDNCYITGNTLSQMQLGNTMVNPGFYLAKYDAAGTLLWVQSVSASASANNYSSGTSLVVNTTGITVTVRAQYMPLTIGTLTLRTPSNFVHFNSQGVAMWAVPAEVGPNTPASQPYFVPSLTGQDAAGNLYSLGTTSVIGPSLTPVVQLGTHTVMGRGLSISRLNAYANTLRGQVYLDQNANGQRDPGEGLIQRQLTGELTQGGATTYSSVGTDGVLQAYAEQGAYSLTLAGIPNHYVVTQPTSSGTYTGNFSGTSQLVDNQDFGVAPTVNQTDLRLTLTPYSGARAGLTTRYRLSLENVGTTTIPAGTATLTLAAQAQYVSSTPTGTIAGRVVSLDYAALAPFAAVSYEVLFSLPTNTALGTALSSSAAAPVTGDVAPADNSATLAQTVVGPYDPNSMEVNYQRLTPAQVAAKQPLDYTIHFQNLGTAYAQNVILSDTLDFQKLNPATLMLVAQSHNCSWSLTSIGANTGLLTVRFLGINLPEQNADVIRSMGFVRFRVQPRPTLAVGEVIPNHARIVFDYNDAIRTNTATTTVFVATAALASRLAPAWETYPNPAADVLNVTTSLPAAGLVRIQLFDGLGRAVRQQALTAPAGPLRQQLDLSGLAPGAYVLRITPPTGPALSRQVVRE